MNFSMNLSFLKDLWSRAIGALPWVKKKTPSVHTGGTCVWRAFKDAPKGFRGAAIAAAKAMASDPEVPVGLSRHQINGVFVEVHKPAPGHLAVIRYCSQG